MIAYHFHPDLEVGALRTVKFAKYLPQFGWEPVIVSVKPTYYEKTDATPLPLGAKVVRSGKMPTPGDLYLGLKRLVRRKTPTQSTQSQATSAMPEGGYVAETRIPYWRRFVNSLSWTPDNHVGWFFPGLWLAIKTARREKVDVIYTSGPPQTGHLIGWITSKVTGKPFVSDFRDPWTDLRKSDLMATGFSRAIERWMERRVVYSSNIVLTTTTEFHDTLKGNFPDHLRNRCFAIVNGFDQDDFPAVDLTPKAVTRNIKFLYAGTLYEGRDPRQFVIALGELVRNGFLMLNEFDVDFYGSVDIDPTPLRTVIEENGLTQKVQFHASVKRTEYLRLINEADVLVLMQSDRNPTQIPAKTFEYLATGNEVLTLTPPGATANIIKGYENVQIANPRSQGEIQTSLKVLISRIRSGISDRQKNIEALKPLHKRELTREFAKLLDSVSLY